MKAEVNPISIKRIEQSALNISWSDGSKSELSARKLRENCPCAGCREARGDTGHSSPLFGAKKGSLKILSSTVELETVLSEIWGVGTYAIGIRFGDGHDTGIYTYGLLKELSCTPSAALA